MNDDDFFEPTEEMLLAGVESPGRWSPTVFVFDLIEIAAGDAKVMKDSLKRISLETGLQPQVVQECVRELIEIGAIVRRGDGAHVVSASREDVEMRLFGF